MRTERYIDTEWGGFSVSVNWTEEECASATPDHGDERWTEWYAECVEIRDDDATLVSFFWPREEKLTNELDKYVWGMIESGELTVND